MKGSRSLDVTAFTRRAIVGRQACWDGAVVMKVYPYDFDVPETSVMKSVETSRGYNNIEFRQATV